MATKRRATGESTVEIHARIYAQRIERLRKLIDLEYDGIITNLIPATTSKEKRSRSSYISQIQSGHRPFTEIAARRIEVDCNKPTGWLDGSSDGALTKKEEASKKRVARLRKLIDSKYDGELDKFLGSHELGPRRKKFIADLLEGTRYMSKGSAELVEGECGLPEGFLDEA